MFGKRPDGIRVKKIDPVMRITPYVMPMRCDAQVFLKHSADLEVLSDYTRRQKLEKKGIGADVMAILPFSENKELEGAKKYTRLLEKRYVKVPNAAKRGKIVSALLSRGYSQEIAM